MLPAMWLGKHSGRLFQHVLKEEDVLPEDVFHIGDNRRSDFKVPTTLGINAKWLYQKGIFDGACILSVV